MADVRDIERIEDEDLLESMISESDDLELKRRVRKRQRIIREKRLAEYEAQRQARLQQHTTEDAVTVRLRRAAEEKQRKLKQFEDRAKEQRQTVGPAEEARRQRQAAAEQERKQKLEHFKEMGKIMSAVYNLGVNDILKDKLQHADDLDVNSFNFFGNGYKTTDNGFGVVGTSFSTKTASPSIQASAKRSDVARNPSAVKQLLLDWCKAQVKGYDNVNLTNFSSSWADGLAFCALIHHFYPNAFDFKKLDPRNRRENFTVAFNAAEKQANIAPLLDVEDLLRMKNPDWKCIFTYVQAFYRRFALQNNKQ